MPKYYDLVLLSHIMSAATLVFKQYNMQTYLLKTVEKCLATKRRFHIEKKNNRKI